MTVRGVLEKRGIVPGKRGLARYVLGTARVLRDASSRGADHIHRILLFLRSGRSRYLICAKVAQRFALSGNSGESRYSFGADATECSSRCRGRTEKNL